MKLTADRVQLFNAVKTALKATGNRKDMPALSGLLFEADAHSGMITVTGTDTHTQIQCRLRNEHVLEGGSLVIKPVIAEMLKLLPDETIEMDAGLGNMLELSSGQCRYSVPFLDAKNFPKTQIPFPEDFICIRGINSIIRRTIIATEAKSQEAHRQSLQFVKLSIANGQTTAEATNGQIAALAQTPHGSDGELDMILHEAALGTLASVVSPDEELYVGVAGNFAVFMKEDLIFSAQLYRGDYIEGSKLLNYVKPVFKATTDAKALYELTENVSSIFGSGDDTCINLCITADSVVMRTKTALGTSHSKVQATETIPTDAAGFNYQAKWLLSCLRQTAGPLVLALDQRGYMLIEANQSKYCVGPRRPVKIVQPDPKKEKKTRSRTARSKAAASAAA